jgi:hypothetical protein
MRLAFFILVMIFLQLLALGVAQETSGPTNTSTQAPLVAPQESQPSSQEKARPTEQLQPAAKPDKNSETQSEAPKSEPEIQAQAEKNRTEPKDPEPQKPDAKSLPSRKTAPAGSTARGRRSARRHGSTEEPTSQIVPGMAPEEADRKRRSAEEMLTATDATLKRSPPSVLNAQQQETVAQIQNYMKGARSALKEGDISRAHTLALKASLLVEDLSRH